MGTRRPERWRAHSTTRNRHDRTMPSTLPKRASAILLSLILAVIAIAGLYTWFTLSWSYSEGDRAGYLQKFSKKGWMCKTWEGEILLSSMPGAIPERFTFTVRDDAVAQQMLKAMGQRVQLTYKQHKGIPTTCFGDTEFFVDKVATGPQAPQAPSNM
jgi:hypothetical protein